MARPRLAYTSYGHESPHAPIALLIHGILGSRRNWASTARRFVERFPDWHCVTVDLRGHGDSEIGHTPNTVAECASDLVALMDTFGRKPECVIGHSFGGKVALAYGHMCPDGIRAIWSLDSDPGISSTTTIHSVTKVIDEIRRVPMPQVHRLAVKKHFEQAGLPSAIGAWMTTNLRRHPDGFHWTFDLHTIEQLLADYRGLDLWSFLEDPHRAVPVHFMLAGESTWWTGHVEERLKRLRNSHSIVLAEAGHWLHIDDPTGMFDALSTTIDAISSIGD